MIWASVFARVAVVLFGWLRTREERIAAQEARVEEIAEAARKTAAIKKTVDALKNGEAEKILQAKWHRPLVVLLAAGVSLSACVSPPVVIDTSCAWVKPILVAPTDRFTDLTAREILALNEAWQARCKNDAVQTPAEKLAR